VREEGVINRERERERGGEIGRREREMSCPLQNLELFGPPQLNL